MAQIYCHSSYSAQLKVHGSLFSKIAFTLAETLIVMGIIGVVAALTLPNLNSSTGDKEKVAKVKKVYQNLEDAFGRAQAVYGPFSEWFNSGSNKDWAKKTSERLIEFMKISKNCELTGTSCWSGETFGGCQESLSGDDYYYKFILSDGTSVGIYCQKPSSDVECEVLFDIDGPNNGVTLFGKDVFNFYIEDNNIVIKGIDSSGDYKRGSVGYLNTTCGDGKETAWVIRNGNMDYLKADSNGKCNSIQLNWDTQISCK